MEKLTPKENPYGPAIIEIETGLWEHDIRVDEGIAPPYSYTDKQFRACLKLFMSAMQWKMWEYIEKKSEKERLLAAEKMGNDLRATVLEFTGIDTHKLY